jgi:acid stress-induced BolA-like protein IbaG/YrbA
MTLDEIKQIIENNIPQSKAYVLDPMGDGQHLQALVISPTFEGMMLIKQHQMVMKPLKEALSGAVHALAVKTFTPEKWNQEKSQYGLLS